MANRRGRLFLASLSGLLAAGLGAVVPGAEAGADQPPAPVSQASLTGQIAAQNARLHTLAVQFGQAQVHGQRLDAELAATQAALAAKVKRVATLRVLLRRQAIIAFTRQGSTSATQELLEQPANDAAVSEGYLSVTTDRVNTTIDALRKASLSLEAERAQLQTAQTQERAALSALSADRQSLLSQVAQEQSLLAKLRTPPPAGPPTQAGLSAIAPPAPKATQSAAFLAPQASPATLHTTPPASPTTIATAPPTTAPPTTAPPTTAPPATTPPTTAPPTTAPPSPPASSNLATDFAELRQCESGGNYQTNTGNGYYGAYQFAESTWLSLGYSGYPNQAPPAVQDQAAERLQAEDGWGPWPACSAMLGL